MRVALRGLQPHLDLDDPELRLTPEQRAAIETRSETVLTAGAGAGKTHTLSLRYVSLLLDLAILGRHDIEAVLVLTFTEKAAEEMAHRCHQRLLALVRAVARVRAELNERDPHGKAGTELLLHVQHMADRFDRARIGTFHGFCASILREFPGQTDTPPGARILEDAESRRMRREALEAALESLVSEEPHVLRPLLDAFGSRHRLVDAGERALQKRGVIDETMEAHAHGEITLAQQLAAAEPSPSDAATWIRGVGHPALVALSRLTAPSGGGPFVQRQLLPFLDRFTAPADDADPLRIYEVYREVLDLLMSDTGKLRTLTHPSVLAPQAKWPGQRRYTLAKRATQALVERLVDWPERALASRRLPTPADRALLEALEPFSRWILQTEARLATIMNTERVLTFEELQLRAIRGVQRDDTLREFLWARHTAIMVDEFQDTDELQWSLVLALGRRHHDVPEGRLFLVGDVKQAIYGFRGGDVTVFRRAATELGVTPLRLPDNFRSKPELIGWFNEAFPHVLGTDPTSPHDAPYEAIRAGRTDPGGRVTLMRGEPEMLGAGWQAETVARLIAIELLAPDSPYVDIDAFPAPPIAILLRARTRQAEFETALRRHHVPFVVAEGVGFWGRQEVIDIVNTVSAVVHADAASMVATLRAPWMGLEDQAIQRVADASRGPDRDARTGLAEFVRGPCPQGDASVQRAHRLLQALDQWRHRCSSADFVAHVAQVYAPARAIADPSGQAEANAQRLVQLVNGWSEPRLEEVADRLLAEVEAGPRESEASIVPAAARVVMCTVHASKGLEFEVVIVPELERRAQSAPETLLVRRPENRARWRLASQVLDPSAPVQTQVKPGLYATLDQVRRSEEDAEERRLLYVAATRARDHLVLVGRTSNPPAPGARASWMQLVEGHTPFETERRDAQLLLQKATPPAPPGPLLDPPASVTRRRLRGVPRVRRLEVAASTLDRFVQCPAWWFRDHRFGPVAPSQESEIGKMIGRLRGQAIHEAIEDRFAVDAEALAKRMATEARVAGAEDPAIDRAIEQFAQHLASCGQDPTLGRALEAEGHDELPIRAEHEGVVLLGRVDRVWRDDDGWVVIDFKSTTLGGRAARPVAAEHTHQLLAYAWALSGGLDGPVVRGDVLLTERGTTVSLGPWTEADRATVPALLEELARVADGDWPQIEAHATATERPCEQCPHHRRGCRGRPW
ncbi:MAG: UvrD-helicase domain-containing protein [Myxococcota bacterium]